MSLYLNKGPIGVCDRCHTKKYLTALRPDGDSPGLMVCKDCWDPIDRYKLKPRETEDISLRVVRPDVELE
jgi:hypothetical protein